MSADRYALLAGIIVAAVMLALMAYRHLAPSGVRDYRKVDESDPNNYGCSGEYELYQQSEDPMGEYRERITGVAIKHAGNSLVYWALPPLRHHNIINNYLAPRGLGGSANVNGRHQGFVTSHGRFVNRREALGIAEGAKQIVNKDESFNKLYSEDLW